MKRLMISLILALVLAIFGAAPAFADFGGQSDAPADHGADDASALDDVVSSDTDNTDESTDVVDVYPAGSEKSVIVYEPFR